MTKKEAIHILNNLKPTNTKSLFDVYKVGNAITMAIQALEQNQKIGYWIRQRGAYGLADTYECSVCGRTIYAEIEDDLKDYPYCHCGAKMEGKIEWK